VAAPFDAGEQGEAVRRGPVRAERVPKHDAEFVVGIGNENVSAMVDPAAAQAWIQRHVQPYLPGTRITCITVGNEVFKSNDTELKGPFTRP
jgi:hypothetical protein